MDNAYASQARLEQVVRTEEEFDAVVSKALPLLLERAAASTRRFLRATGQWNDDVAHEKLVIRWGAEYMEQFLVCGKHEVPCRPLFLLDALVARQCSKPDPFCYHPDLLSPFGQLLDGLLARAAISRDALIALYHHCYGLAPSQIIAILGLAAPESQRIYKNLQRWRESGWQRTMEDNGVTREDLGELERQRRRYPERFNSEAARLLRLAQNHYRKSEPDHYACLPPRQWEDMFEDGYGGDYRTWHLAYCLECFVTVGAAVSDKPRVDFNVRP